MELDEAEKQGKNGQRFVPPGHRADWRHTVEEIAVLRKEALAYEAICNALRSSQTIGDTTKTVFALDMAVLNHHGLHRQVFNWRVVLWSRS